MAACVDAKIEPRRLPKATNEEIQSTLWYDEETVSSLWHGEEIDSTLWHDVMDGPEDATNGPKDATNGPTDLHDTKIEPTRVKPNLIGLPRTDLIAALTEHGHKPFRAAQLYNAIYQKGTSPFFLVSCDAEAP